jgi:hypothetical protein
MKILSKNTEAMAWFESVSTRKENGCLLWNRYKINDGYGRMTFMGKQVLTHRLSLLLSGGMIPNEFCNPEVVVMHTCDTPACVEPTHLKKATQEKNIEDRDLKGRTAKHLNRRDEKGRFRSNQCKR